MGVTRSRKNEPIGPGSNAISRRSLLRGLGALGAASLAFRGTALAADGDFRFIVVNDLHHATAECDPFFRRLVAQMASHGTIDLCLIVGDLADAGKPESFTAVREAFAPLGVPIYTVPGNHDCDVEKNTRLYSEAFPGRLNYVVRHNGWQFIGLDSTQGNSSMNTRIADATLSWLDTTVPTLDRATPTVVFTHFPLANGVNMMPLNAGDVRARLAPLNLRGGFNGHYHARIERRDRDVPLITNACCSRVRDNHDGSLEEGYLLCSASSDGKLSWEFVEFVAARKQVVGV